MGAFWFLTRLGSTRIEELQIEYFNPERAQGPGKDVLTVATPAIEPGLPRIGGDRKENRKEDTWSSWGF